MYNALDIATWFIYKTNSEKKEKQMVNDDFDIYEGITHLKLQKLLYFAQGITLATLEKPLFNEKIVAWEHGPVIKEVYDVYHKYGKKELKTGSTNEKDRIVSQIENDNDVAKTLNFVYDNFAIYTAWQLRDMTHEEGTPWDVTVKDKGLNNEIDKDLIKKYFEEVILEA